MALNTARLPNELYAWIIKGSRGCFRLHKPPNGIDCEVIKGAGGVILYADGKRIAKYQLSLEPGGSFCVRLNTAPEVRKWVIEFTGTGEGEPLEFDPTMDDADKGWFFERIDGSANAHKSRVSERIDGPADVITLPYYTDDKESSRIENLKKYAGANVNQLKFSLVKKEN